MKAGSDEPTHWRRLKPVTHSFNSANASANPWQFSCLQPCGRSMFGITVRQLIFGTILGSLLFAFAQCAPVYFYAWEFDDFIKDEVKFAPLRESTYEDHLRAHILDLARHYKFDLDPKQIRISKTPTIPGMSWQTLSVEVTYSAPVDLDLFTRELHFHTIASIAY